jgi:hypothetical protein
MRKRRKTIGGKNSRKTCDPWCRWFMTRAEFMGYSTGRMVLNLFILLEKDLKNFDWHDQP